MLLRQLVLLLSLAPALAWALGGQGDDGDRDGFRRALRQAPGDCSTDVPHCSGCRLQINRGAATRYLCVACREGYIVKASGRACWCGPGYYSSSNGTCDPCGANYWCPGAKSTALSGEARFPCGNNKYSSSGAAVSERECLVKDGYGWAPGDGSAPCEPGTYNAGGNNRKCSACPEGLTTQGPAATSPDACVAPPGFGFARGRAAACPQGTFKAGYNTDPCSDCPEGWTTEPGANAKAAATDCAYALPGFAAPAGQLAALGTPNATVAPCAAHSYRGAPARYDAAADSAGLPCTPCPAGLQTQSEGALSAEACLAPPGVGFDGAAAAPCGRGSFKEGWGRGACVACGAGNWSTEAEGAASPDACKLPAGYGARRQADGAWEAFPCPAGSFGHEHETLGRQEVACTKCTGATTTGGPGAASPLECVPLPGHGWGEDGVQQCGSAYWSPGGSMEPCQYCGEGYNTTDGAPGADDAGDCVIAAGWASDGRGGVKPCMQGTYKSALGDSPCLACPAGTTTTSTIALKALSECDACRPGFGAAAIDAAAPACGACASGTFSPGYVRGGGACKACPKPDGYDGKMVSRRGLSSPEGCHPEFTTGTAKDALPWNVIAMAPSALADAGNLTAPECEALCGATAGCQYYTSTDNAAAGAACQIRDKGVGPANTGVPGRYIAFKIAEATYVVYNADASDWASTGADLGSYPTRAAAQAACDAAPACAGLKSSEDAGQWRAFRGATQARVTSKVRVWGDAVNAWAPEAGSG